MGVGWIQHHQKQGRNSLPFPFQEPVCVQTRESISGEETCAGLNERVTSLQYQRILGCVLQTPRVHCSPWCEHEFDVGESLMVSQRHSIALTNKAGSNSALRNKMRIIQLYCRDKFNLDVLSKPNGCCQ